MRLPDCHRLYTPPSGIRENGHREDAPHFNSYILRRGEANEYQSLSLLNS